MSQGFIKLKRSERLEWLIKNHIYAFSLLTLIALRARRTPNCPDGFEIGECHIGDYLSAGIPSEKAYRTAKAILVRERAVIICETCRKRKKGATGRATVGTKVKLLDSEFYDINIEQEGDRKGDRGATEGRPRGDEQERKETKNVKKDVFEEVEPNPTIVSFSSFSKEENGIVPLKVRVFLDNHRIVLSNTDLEAWCALYDSERVIRTLEIMLEQKKPVMNPGGWLMKAFRDNYYQRDANWKICQQFQSEYPSIKIKVLKSWATDLENNVEIPYNIGREDIIQRLNLILENKRRKA